MKKIEKLTTFVADHPAGRRRPQVVRGPQVENRCINL